MATRRVFVVFVLPVIFSLIVGSVVLGGILQKPDRELNMWPMSFSEGGSSHNSSIEIMGLSNSYSTLYQVFEECQPILHHQRLMIKLQVKQIQIKLVY